MIPHIYILLYQRFTNINILIFKYILYNRQDQWSKPTKPKGHWQKNRLKPWAGRHGYESVNGWRGNSAKTILLDQIQQDAQK